MQIDLEGMPFVDGHMHAPLAVRPATADDYAWPWYEGNREYLEIANELDRKSTRLNSSHP